MKKKTVWITVFFFHYAAHMVSDQVRHNPGYMAKDLKFQILEEEGLYMYYLCSENKGADQLYGYRTADLRL